MIYKELFLILIMIALSACHEGVARNDGLSMAESSPGTVMPTLVPTPQQTLDTSIRKVDFQNFTYVGPDDYSETFALKNGEKAFVLDKEDGIFLGNILYDDLTGDGREEAIIRMEIQTGGSAIPDPVFVYTLADKKPKNLWKFVTGDRAEGGLKDVYAIDGILIVELYGDNKFKNGMWESTIPDGKFKGFCCPTVYTRTKFKWDGKEFVVKDIPELFDIAHTYTERS